MKSIAHVMNGPNLNLRGQRQPEIYVHDTLADVEALCGKVGTDLDLDIVFRQTNHEGACRPYTSGPH